MYGLLQLINQLLIDMELHCRSQDASEDLKQVAFRFLVRVK